MSNLHTRTALVLLATLSITCQADAAGRALFRGVLGGPTFSNPANPSSPGGNPSNPGGGGSGGGQPEVPEEPEVPNVPQVCHLKVAPAQGGSFDVVVDEQFSFSTQVDQGSLPQGGAFVPFGLDESRWPEAASFDNWTGDIAGFAIEPTSIRFKVLYVPLDADGNLFVDENGKALDGASFQTCESDPVTLTARLGAVNEVQKVRQCDAGTKIDLNDFKGPSFTYAMYGSPLPGNMSFDQVNGAIVGATTAPAGSTWGPFRIAVRQNDQLVGYSNHIGLEIVPANEIKIAEYPTSGFSRATVGQPHRIQFAHTGIGGSYTYEFSPALPAWLSHNTSFAVATYGYVYDGTPPSGAKSWTGTATLRNECGTSISKTFTIAVGN